MLKNDPHVFTGMRRDTSISKQQPQYLFNARNIRFTARTGDTSMSITNEKGPSRVTTFEGYYLGHCVLNNYLVIFTKTATPNNSVDRIYRFDAETSNQILLYEGNLNFKLFSPIDTLGYYELENLQKVYWIDGVNQPRVINIKKPELLDLIETSGTNKGLYKQNKSYEDAFPTSNSFDFIKNLQLEETIEVSRTAASGLFPSGVIQYCITYSNLYDSETNIAETTPLYSITFNDRGGSGEEAIPASFKIKINNVDKNFEYLHVYSILRTSLNGTPQVKLVDKIYIKNLVGDNIELIDTNTGSTVDSSYLLYVGGEDIRPNCFAQKDNTAFFGNYVEYRKSIRRSLGSDFSKLGLSSYTDGVIKNTPTQQGVITLSNGGRALYLKPIDFKASSVSEYVNYMQSLAVEAQTFDSTPTSTEDFTNLLSPTNYFRGNEFYRLGLQFQHVTGKWSEPVWVGDVQTSDYHPAFYDGIAGESTEIQVNTLQLPELVASINISNLGLTDNQYVKVRPLVVFPSITESNILCQGILAPTVYSDALREKGTPSNQASWFIRPFWDSTTPTLVPLDENDLPLLGVDPPTDSSTEGPTEEPTEEPTLEPQYTETPIIPEKAFSKAKAIFKDDGTIHSILINPSAFDVLERWSKKREVFYNQNTLDDVDVAGSGATYTDYFSNEQFIKYGSLLECRHNQPLYSMLNRGGELEYDPSLEAGDWSVGADSHILYKKLYENLTDNNSKYFQMSSNSGEGLFKVDQSVLTVHSPDIIYNSNFALLKWNPNDYNLNIAGKAYYTLSIGGVSLQTSSAAAVSKGGGFKKIRTIASGLLASRGLCAGLLYEDSLMDNKGDKLAFPYDCVNDTGSETASDTVLFMVYPWQKSGSINNDAKRSDGSTQTSVLSKKCLYNFKSSAINTFTVNNNPFGPNDALEYTMEKGLTSLQYFGSDQVSLVRLDDGSSYYGNIDTVIPTTLGLGKLFTLGNMVEPEEYANRISKAKGPLSPLDPLGAYTYLGAQLYNKTTLDATSTDGWIKYKKTDASGTLRYDTLITGAPGNTISALRFNKEPIRMKYKSTPHLVVSLEYSNNRNYLGYSYKQESNDLNYGFSYIGELHKKTVEPSTLFGGTSAEALQANNWIVAGKSVRLDSAVNNAVEVRYSWGDTWYQRFDCLKTYPFTFEDENQIIEIASFMVETKINLDGRYDRNKNPNENFNLSPTNYGLLNDVYSQRDNFFNYRILPDMYYDEQKFPSTFFWTKEKVAGEEVDSWTNINLANQWLMDGTYGKLNSIISWNNRLFAFQDRAISAISFNPRVEIATTDGVPVEIANSKKLEGVVTIDTNRGCINKWEIASTESGVYFRDSISKDLCHIGNDVTSIGSTHGFDYWFKNQYSLPFTQFSSNGGNKLFIDKYYKDLYYVNSSEALVFSELLGEFTSFMDYGSMIALFNLGGDTYSIKSTRNSSYQERGTSLYRMFAGNYNKYFFDTDPSVEPTYKSFGFSFISNADSSLDKTFSTVEVQADFYKENITTIPTPPPESAGFYKNPINNEYIKTWGFFNRFRVQTEYQDSWGPLTNPTQPPFNIKNHTYSPTTLDSIIKGDIAKKFRTWRVSVPRDANSKYSRDRIRNQWCKIQFGLDNPEDTKMELHNINVQYFT